MTAAWLVRTMHKKEKRNKMVKLADVHLRIFRKRNVVNLGFMIYLLVYVYELVSIRVYFSRDCIFFQPALKLVASPRACCKEGFRASGGKMDEVHRKQIRNILRIF